MAGSLMDLAFTFGIITDCSPDSCKRLPVIIDSIRRLHIPEYQIIIVGQADKIRKLPYLGPEEPHLEVIDFDETVKKSWITKKKNLITQHAKYENIVYQHDYIIYDSNWYSGWQKFGDNFKACMNPITNVNGNRYRDWSIFPDIFFDDVKAYSGFEKLECLLPYEEISLSRWMYFSGGYWVAKKSVMEEFPLNENLGWGEGEDALWSYHFRQKYQFSINAHSTVRILDKYHDPSFTLMRPHVLNKIKEYKDLQDAGQVPPMMTFHEMNLKSWYDEDAKRGLRYIYLLNNRSIVFDLGAYKGEWAKEIIRRFGSCVYAFEPIPEFAENLRQQIDPEQKLKVFPIALGGSTREDLITVMADGSSMYEEGANKIKIKVESIAEFIRAHGLKNIDLLKLNIEGAEYEVLESLIDSNMLPMFRYIQIQFHRTGNNYLERRKNIINKLSKTHKNMYDFEYVWESWERKDG